MAEFENFQPWVGREGPTSLQELRPLYGKVQAYFSERRLTKAPTKARKKSDSRDL
jgi:hypothetical protein